jgi:branched-chain amino acid transport system substrate-binding protein
MEIVLEEEYAKGVTDMASLITKIKTKKPDILIGATYLPGSVALVRQSKKLNFNARIFAFSNGPGLPYFRMQLSDDANFVFSSSQWEPNLTLPGVDDFVKRYEATYGYKPGYHAAGGYGAGQVLEEAVNNAGSLNRERVRKSLSTLQTTTVFGSYHVDETGRQIGKPAYMVQWVNGQKELVLPEDVSTAESQYPTPPWADR